MDKPTAPTGKEVLNLFYETARAGIGGGSATITDGRLGGHPRRAEGGPRWGTPAGR
jgi:hypothetical protein